MQWEVANGLIIVGTVDTLCLVFFLGAIYVDMGCSETKYSRMLCSCSLSIMVSACFRSLLVSVVYSSSVAMSHPPAKSSETLLVSTV